MTATSYPLIEAAKLADWSYEPDQNPAFKKLIKAEKGGDSRAYLLKNGFLIIPGSDSIADYAKYNLRISCAGITHMKLRTSIEKGSSGTNWHQGFLRHAREIDAWLGRRRPKLIIGHSLGAASAQILSMSYKVAGIAFAAPRTHKGKVSRRNGQYCLCVCRMDDPVGFLPDGFSHVGRPLYLTHKLGNGFIRHEMRHYIDVLRNNKSPRRVPGRWKN